MLNPVVIGFDNSHCEEINQLDPCVFEPGVGGGRHHQFKYPTGHEIGTDERLERLARKLGKITSLGGPDIITSRLDRANGIGVGIIIEQLVDAFKRARPNDVWGDGELVFIKRHGGNIHPGHISLKSKGAYTIMSSTRSAGEACQPMHNLEDPRWVSTHHKRRHQCYPWSE
jgi:hypothetical protein